LEKVVPNWKLGKATAADVHRGDIVSVTPYGDDLEIIFNPRRAKAMQ